MKKLVLLVCALVLPASVIAQSSSFGVDTAAIAKIKDEEMNRSKVMEILSYLSDVYGPRLNGSPEYEEAARWAKSEMESWGLQNVHFENWGPWGKGWTLKSFSAEVLSPRAFPLIAYPKAWSPGLRGETTADVVFFDVKSRSDFPQYKGKLKGKFVLISQPRTLNAHFQADAERLTDSRLLERANADIPTARQRRRPQNLANLPPGARDSAMFAMMRRFMPNADSLTILRRIDAFMLEPAKIKFCQDEGAAAVLDISPGDDGTVFVAGATVPQDEAAAMGRGIQPYAKDVPKIVPQVTIAAEHYNRMVRMIEKGQHLKISMALDVKLTPVDSSFNIIAEIPGTDLRDEVVMLGGHFDSWHAGTGATDDGTGCAAAMEALRILKATGLQPRRTIRVALWAGEEEGLLGSRGYVARHYAEQETDMMSMEMGASSPMTTKAEYGKFSVYFNHDNGTGRVRGVYMQGNENTRPIFRAWLKAIGDSTAQTLTLSNTGGTDHLSFDAVGLPGFQFIQDPIDYGSRTHHSNMDVYDRVQEPDMKQAATMMAIFAHNAAMMDQKFPRKEMPAPMQSAPAQ